MDEKLTIVVFPKEQKWVTVGHELKDSSFLYHYTF